MFDSDFYRKYEHLNKYIAILGTSISLIYLFKNLEKISFSSIRLNFFDTYLLMTIFAYAIYIFCRSYFWESIFQQKKGSYEYYLAAQIGKFIPGKIGPTYFRSLLLKDRFLSQAKMSFQEIIYIFLAHSSIALIFFLFKELSIILFGILIFAIKRYRLLLLNSALIYLSFYSLSIYLGNNFLDSFGLVSCLIISSVISLFINIIPFGLGVREGIFLFLYSFFSLNGNISDLIIYSRIISIFLEGLVYLIYFFKYRRYFAK